MKNLEEMSDLELLQLRVDIENEELKRKEDKTKEQIDDFELNDEEDDFERYTNR